MGHASVHSAAEHAFRVVDRETRDLEALPTFTTVPGDVDAVDRAVPRTGTAPPT